MIYVTYGFHKQRSFSGHIYELIDYFVYLHKHYYSFVKILLPPNIPRQLFLQCLRCKYVENVHQMVIDNIVTWSDIKLTDKDVILSVDGTLFPNMSKPLKFGAFIGLRCDTYCYKEYLICKRYIMLQDYRLYGDTYLNFEVYHYKKKIYFGIIKESHKEPFYPTALVYSTKELRYNLNITDLLQYEFKEYLIANENKELTLTIKDKLFVYKKVPIDSIFDKFSCFIYIPPITNFDCSNRFIKECQYFDKQILFYNNVIPLSVLIRLFDPLPDIDLSYDEELPCLLEDVLKCLS